MLQIIAKNDGGFIVDIAKSDLEMLTGYYYGNKELRIGDQLTIDSLYRQLNNLTSQECEIKDVIHRLKTAIGLLDKIDPIFYDPKVE